MTAEPSTPPPATTSSPGLGDVLTLFRETGPLTRAEVMTSTGLSRSTVNQRIDALLQGRLIVGAGEQAPTRGRPAERFCFNRARGVLLVADLGATAMRVAVCDLAGDIQSERDVPVDVQDGPVRVLERIDAEFTGLLADAGVRAADVLGIGLDVPGPVDSATGRVVSPPIMNGWDGFDIRGWFATRYRCPVLVEKDVNAMAWGEQRLSHPDVADLLMLKVGTGVGGGLVSGGAIFRGADGAAGDIGHLHVDLPGTGPEPECRCGNTGCVEAYAGGWALARDLANGGVDVHTVDDVVALIRSGDLAAVRLARRAGRALGEGIAHAVNLFNPRVIVVGGQLARVEEQLFAGIREMVYRRSLPLATRNLQIVRSRLDRRAGLIGLALLLADTIFAADQVERLVSDAG
jgi:predicted NBD/HSP70 family sugar kinase